MNYYIADTHWSHRNILRYDNRPFSSLHEHDMTLIENWNNTVTDADDVYILGDYSWNTHPETDIQLLKSLKGKKHLILGNHDKIRNKEERDCFVEVKDYKRLVDNGTVVILSHYPIAFWDGQFHDSVHLYGHVHNSHQWYMFESWMQEGRELQLLPMRAYNVGCMMDYMQYTPMTLDQIINGYNKVKEVLKNI